MTAVAIDTLTTAELLDELEQRLRSVGNGAGGKPADHGLHWKFSATGPAPTSAHILRIRMDLAGLTKGSFSTAFGVPADVVEEWLSERSPVPPWVLPALRVYEMLPVGARQKVLRTPAARAGNRSENTHPFARIEEL
jgi:hypothetical protein